MSGLIERLGKASEGSDALDREIAAACKIEWSPDEDGNFGGYNILPRRCWFTRSLDAALTLVPEGWAVHRIDQYHDRHSPAWGWGARLRCHVKPDVGIEIGESRASMELAICIAALKAILDSGGGR